ncbi:MAG: hypothetical protein FWD57_04315, partial [Polyangiaceae bacterium]|nr:hypothetical protein [Polyangiaceae bacterium]
ENEKLMCIRIVKDRLRFVYDNQGYYNSHTVINCVRLDKLQNADHNSARKALKNADIELCSKYDYRYLLGILNSNLINWYFRNFLFDDLNFYPNHAKCLPIRAQNKDNEQLQNESIKHVDQLLQLNKQLQTATVPESIEHTKSKIRYCEDKINEIVYALYALTDEEVSVIESKYCMNGENTRQ